MAHIKHTTHMSDDEAHPKGVDTVAHEVAEVLSVLNKDSSEVVDSRESSEADADDSDEESGSEPYAEGKRLLQLLPLRALRLSSVHPLLERNRCGQWRVLFIFTGGSLVTPIL
jgi:hypothetical protein